MGRNTRILENQSSSGHPCQRLTAPVMFIDILLAFLCALSFLPLTTGYCAYSYGRSFWVWFTLGCVLPIVSFFILFALLYRKEMDRGEQLLAEAKSILAEAEARGVKIEDEEQ
jgi:Trk-type K+ transport system membrane component